MTHALLTVLFWFFIMGCIIPALVVVAYIVRAILYFVFGKSNVDRVRKSIGDYYGGSDDCHMGGPMSDM